MKIFALSDLHLSFNENFEEYKPMGVFGETWERHSEKIEKNWKEMITAEDIVLIPGDISWALKLEEAKHDFLYLEKLPGLKILTKGNHDLWWQSLTKVREFLPEGIEVLQNESYLVNDKLAIAGTRGWISPEDKSFTEEDDRKIYKRELGRLRLSLESIKEEVEEIIVMLHYPPASIEWEKSEFIELMKEYPVKTCIYGHLHGHSIKAEAPDHKWGIDFHLVSGDALGFVPKLIKNI